MLGLIICPPAIRKRSSPVRLLASLFATTMLVSCGVNQQPEGIRFSSTGPSQNGVELEAGESSKMNNRRLEQLLKKHFPDRKIEGQGGLWRIALKEEDVKDESVELFQENSEAKDPPESKPETEQNGKPLAEEVEPLEEAPGADKHLPPVIVVMTDERANRMRIMMPIRPFDTQSVDDLQLALIALHANYDRALDARYAIQEGMLWSAFIHPLSSLTPADLSSAIKQVIALHHNTGTSYSSGAFIFAPSGVEQEGPEEESAPKTEGTGDNVT